MKKTILLSALLMLTALISSAQCTPAAELQEGLVGYWPFCGNTNDESGNSLNGIVAGEPLPYLVQDRFEIPNSAFFFPDTQSIMIVPEPSLGTFSNGSLTFSFWIISEPATGNLQIIDFAGHRVQITSDSDRIIVLPYSGNTTDNIFEITSPILSNSIWKQVAVVLDQQDVLIYLNGTLHSTHTGNPEFPIIYSDGSFWLGMIGFETCPHLALDDIGIWNRALTAEEVAQLYGNFVQPITYYLDSDGDGYGDPNFTQESATGAPAGYVTDNTDCHDSNANVFPGASCDDQNALTTSDAYNTECACTGTPVALSCDTLPTSLQEGLVGYWPFCGNANDESGNGNDGIVNGATLTEDRFGNANQSYLFSLNDITVPIPNSQFATDFAISTWVIINSYSESSNNYPTFIWEENAGLVMQGEALNGEEKFNCYFLDNYNIGGEQVEDGGVQAPASLSQWNHVVLSNENGINSLYVNGVLADVSLSASALQGVQAGNYLKFGGGGTLDIEYFFGKLDDIGIWDRALTPEEVALLYGNFTQTIPGCTDPLAYNYNPQATVNEGCEYITTIFVFNDLNGNGTHEANEPGLTNWPVLGNDINSLVWTNGNGNAFLPLEGGLYEFTVLNTTDNWVSTTPTSVTIDLTGGPATATFGLQVIPGEAIVAAGPFTGFWDILHCTDGYESGVYLENIGSQAVSGFMTLTCDPLFTPNADSYFTTPPVEVGPGYALWNVEDFQPGEYELLSFHIDGPGVEYLNQSFTFAFDLTLFDPQGNMIYSDNWSVSPIVACAYDPNDITGFPEGLSAPHEEGYTIEHYILPDNMVEFRVRFQNTGTLPAEDIDIYIPIDPNQWELSTIFPLMRSAEMQVICLHDDGLDLSILEHELPEGITAEDLLIFSFDDINLPDSASDPEGSQGYVYFRMQAKHTLSIGDEINAQAFIYFEENPPIATNETYHVLFDCESFTPMVGDAELCAGDDLQFSASQPNVDEFAWNIATLEGSGNIFIFEGIDAGEYTLELNTSNMLCPQGEDHEVTIIVYDTPMLDLPLDVAVCAGEQVVYDTESDGTVIWSNGASTGDVFTAEESFTVTATAVGAGGCSTSEDWTVTVNPLPSAEVDSANFVLTAADGVAWQWSVNGVLDATTQSINATENGTYQVEITSEFGCVVMSDVIVVELPIPDNVFVHSWSTLSLFPNPMTTSARLELPQGVFDIALYDLNGTCVRRLSNQQDVVMIERDALASGVYQIQVTHGANTKSIRLVVE